MIHDILHYNFAYICFLIGYYVIRGYDEVDGYNIYGFRIAS